MNSVTLKLLLVACVLSLSVTGCRKGAKGVTPIPGKMAGVPGGEKPSGLENAGQLPKESDTSSTRRPGDTIPLGEREGDDKYWFDRETFKQQTLYFDFDKSSVKQSERPKVEAVASYLKNQPTNHLRVEGHCDERGTPEYNRALGERRALTVREYLVNLGIAPDRVSTISFGEDKPADPGHDESAWAKNRRAEFILLKPKQ